MHFAVRSGPPLITPLSLYFFCMKDVAQLETEALRKLIDCLFSVGCSKYVELPMIAVMGDTSCGKSSLLSALSGIEFPSSEKLTTRCPTQIIMTNNKQQFFQGILPISQASNVTQLNGMTPCTLE
jgi:ABC-type lipoprotein export system ATPase subunit